MPDEGSALPTDSRSAVALSERVAVIETQQHALKEDTGVIRSSIHSINNEQQKVVGEMQKFVAAEQRCADNLAQINEKLKDLPSIIQMAAAFSEMRGELHDVIDDRKQRQGIAAFGRKFAMIVAAGAGLMTFLGGMAVGLTWFIKHLWQPALGP